MLSNHRLYFGSGMGALFTVCTRTTNVTVVWAWVLCLPYALEPRMLLWFGHGCSGYRMLSNNECYYGLGMGAMVTVCKYVCTCI